MKLLFQYGTNQVASNIKFCSILRETDQCTKVFQLLVCQMSILTQDYSSSLFNG